MQLLLFVTLLASCAAFSSAPGSCSFPSGFMSPTSSGDAVTAGGYTISAPSEYSAAVTYTISVTGTSADIRGFQLWVTDGNNQRVGSFADSPNGPTRACPGAAGSTIGHNGTANCNGQAQPCAQMSLTFSWTAPGNAQGDLTLNGVLVRTTQEWYVITATMTAPPAPQPTPPPPPPTQQPTQPPQDCDLYCTQMEDNCFGSNIQYFDRQTCLRFCQAMPQGQVDATSGDSLACRQYHIGAAGIIPGVHCPHAGASGGDACGSWCEVYCRDLSRVCEGEFNLSSPVGQDMAGCVATCETWATNGDATVPSPFSPPGPNATVQCRSYHLQVASGSAAAAQVHCPHAGPSGGNVCGTVCDAYCDVFMTACDGTASNYASRAACMTACAGFDDTAAPGSTSGDTLQCRLYHAQVAQITGATVHCEHSQEVPTAFCNDPCADFCADMQANCSGTNSQFLNAADCETICNRDWPAGINGATSGNSLACRQYHYSVAVTGNPDTHCPHAGPYGGNACGSPCENFCTTLFGTCDSLGLTGFVDMQECMTWCASYPSVDGTASAPLFPTTTTSGPSLQCRAYHLQVAQGDATTHCPHAAKYSDSGVCGDDCDAYCSALEFNCPTTFATDFGDLATCRTACLAYPVNTTKVFAGDSKECRLYHVGVALTMTQDNIHCTHASLDGGGVCTDACEDFCTEMETQCSGTYNDRAHCLAECAAMPFAGTNADDSYTCRRAALDNLDCEGAGPQGGATCGTPCPNFCRRVFAACTSPMAAGYSDLDTCVAFCEAIEASEITSVDHTVACRADAVSAGFTSGVCTDATLGGGATCGGPGVTFCGLAPTACPATYTDTTACEDAVLVFLASQIDQGTPGDTGGNSAECRLYHMGVAYLTAQGGSADNVHCDHASVSGGGVCVNPPDCAEFCTVAAACDPAVYVDCADSCSRMDPGLLGDTSGNTLACRQGNAEASPQNCAAASFSGGGVCGTRCEAYCQEHLDVCNAPGGDPSQRVYTSYEQCLGRCAAYDTTGADDNSATSGDTLQCRTYHTQVARQTPGQDHCLHGGIRDSAGVCADTCEAYCTYFEHECQSTFTSDYTDRAGCISACNGLATGLPGATAGNTSECRLYHVGVAIDTGDAVHCTHASLGGGGVCVDQCEVSYTVTTASKAALVAGEYPVAYFVDGTEAPPLCLVRGTQYCFEVQNSCFHPFYFTTSATGGAGDLSGAVTAGVTGGATACDGSTLTITPEAGTPDSFFYQCDFHNAMGGSVQVVDSISDCASPTVGTSAPPPTTGEVSSSGVNTIVSPTMPPPSNSVPPSVDPAGSTGAANSNTDNTDAGGSDSGVTLALAVVVLLLQ